MTHSNYTRNILNIEDENIIFEENCFEISIVKVNATLKTNKYCIYLFKPKSCI